MNIVIVKHPNNYKGYVFEVPEGKSLKKGDKVLVMSKKGQKDVTCDCDSFEVPEGVVHSLLQSFGGTVPLAKVIGKYHFELWDESKLSENASLIEKINEIKEYCGKH